MDNQNGCQPRPLQDIFYIDIAQFNTDGYCALPNSIPIARFLNHDTTLQ